MAGNTIPDIEWYTDLSETRKVQPRCPFASVEICPRYFQSLSLLGCAGSTNIEDADEVRLLDYWKKSDLWSKTGEYETSVAGPKDNPKIFSNFCPEIAFDRFGYFASFLAGYADEIDSDSAHARLARRNASAKDWRWSWSSLTQSHYTDCHYYSILDHRSKNDRFPFSVDVEAANKIHTNPVVMVNVKENGSETISKRRWFANWWRDRGIQGAILGALATLIAAFGPQLWLYLFPKKSDVIHVERHVAYVRMLHFVDRHLNNANPIRRQFVGLPDQSHGTEIDLFDEAFYLEAFYIASHKVPFMKYHASSSGYCAITPIVPTDMNPGIGGYMQSGWKRIEVEFPMEDLGHNRFHEYLLATIHFYNGFQYNTKANRYESNGGFSIQYPTDSLKVIFDFSALDYQNLLKSRPTVRLKRKEINKVIDVPVTYVDGVLVAENISNLKPGDGVLCDWEWTTEAPVIAAQKKP